MSKDKNSKLYQPTPKTLTAMKALNTILFAAAALISATSCNNRAYEHTASYTPGNEVYTFEKSSVKAVYEPGQAPATLEVTIARDNADKAATLVLASAAGQAQFAPAVNFEKGAREATLTIDLANLRAGSAINDTIFLAPDFKTKAGKNYIALDLSMGYTWTRLTDAGCSYALLTDGLISPAVCGTSATFPVMIEEAVEAPGMYRLINPLGVYSKSENDLIIDATNPNEVKVLRQSTGINFGQGSIAIESLGAYHEGKGRRHSTIRMAGYYGTLENGIITFAGADSFNLYTGSEKNRTNHTGTFRIVLPSMVAAVEKTISKEHYNMGVAYLQSPEALAAGHYAMAD